MRAGPACRHSGVVVTIRRIGVQVIARIRVGAVGLTLACRQRIVADRRFRALGQFGLVLAKDNPLTTCVDIAMQAIIDSGELEALTTEWLADNTGAPFISE